VARKAKEAYVDKPVRSYQDLVAWQKAMDLVTKIYRVSHKFPREEIFALTSQLRRAAVSVPSNIAEGQGKIVKKRVSLFFRKCQGFFVGG
jgi:four helix bundle protein